MNVSSFHTERVRFAIYRYWGRDPSNASAGIQLLYLGYSRNYGARDRQHAKESVWHGWSTSASQHFHTCTEAEIQAIEASSILSELPLFNGAPTEVLRTIGLLPEPTPEGAPREVPPKACAANDGFLRDLRSVLAQNPTSAPRISWQLLGTLLGMTTAETSDRIRSYGIKSAARTPTRTDPGARGAVVADLHRLVRGQL